MKYGSHRRLGEVHLQLKLGARSPAPVGVRTKSSYRRSRGRSPAPVGVRAKSSRRLSITMETWVESVHREESSPRWWGHIHRQNLRVLRRLGRQRGSERCHRRSEVGRIPGGSLLSRTSAGGYFIPNTSPPTSEFEFRMKKVQKNFRSRSYPLESCARSPPDILALNARMLESFRIGVVRGDASKTPQVRWPRYGAIMTLPTASRL